MSVLDIFDDLTPQPWMKEGVCRDYESPDDWYGSGRHEPRPHGFPASARRAVAICKTCPVMAECAEYAIERREVYGIYGGLTPFERREMRRKERGTA